jgi:hypothetical protein
MGSTAPAFSAEAVKVGGYEFNQPADVLADNACQAIAADKLSNQAEGLTALEFTMPTYWDSLIKGVRFFTYSNVVARSDYGDTNATVVCALAPDQNVVVEIAFVFDDKGLAGFKSFLNKPRSESYRLSHVMQTPTQITGTK